MSTPAENPSVPETPIFDPFPQPNTMPAGWDLSGLTPAPQPAPAVPTDEAPDAPTL